MWCIEKAAKHCTVFCFFCRSTWSKIKTRQNYCQPCQNGLGLRNSLNGPDLSRALCSTAAHRVHTSIHIVRRLGSGCPCSSRRAAPDFGFHPHSEGGSNEPQEDRKCREQVSWAGRRRCRSHELRAAVGQHGRRQTRCTQHAWLCLQRKKSRKRGSGQDD